MELSDEEMKTFRKRKKKNSSCLKKKVIALFFIQNVMTRKKRKLWKKVIAQDIGQVLFLRVYGPISSLLHRTGLVSKGFIIWLSGKVFLRDTADNPERARLLHLQRKISFTLPAHGASHMIKHISIICNLSGLWTLVEQWDQKLYLEIKLRDKAFQTTRFKSKRKWIAIGKGHYSVSFRFETLNLLAIDWNLSLQSHYKTLMIAVH